MVCEHQNGDVTRLFGVPVDPCVYEEIERYANATVIVQRCVKCGQTAVRWVAQPDTVRLPTEEESNDE